MSEKAGHPAPATFDDFWKEYPRKVCKPAALRMWKRAIKKAKPETIIAAVIQYALAYKEAETEQCMIPHPRTWLCQERWNDPVESHVSTAVRKQKIFERQHREAAIAAKEAGKLIAQAPPEFKKLASRVPTRSDNQAMHCAWQNLPEAERNGMIEAVQATFGDNAPNYGVAKRIAIGQWWRDQKGE